MKKILLIGALASLFVFSVRTIYAQQPEYLTSINQQLATLKAKAEQGDVQSQLEFTKAVDSLKEYLTFDVADGISL